MISPLDHCRALAEQAGEPLAGTAAKATHWLLIEDNGPWGRDVLALGSRAAYAVRGIRMLGALEFEGDGQATVRFQLVRRNVRDRTADRRRIWLAETSATPPHMEFVGELDELGAKVVLRRRAGRASADTPPQYLVCTNGKRDACCALFGRDVARELYRQRPEVTWETSHTGGHRFAAAVIVLPWGLTYGRVTPADVDVLVAATERGEIWPAGYRGRSSHPQPAQCAAIAVRTRTGVFGIADLQVRSTREYGSQATVIGDVQGRPWRAIVRRRVVEHRGRPLSCGASAEPIGIWEVRDLRIGDA